MVWENKSEGGGCLVAEWTVPKTNWKQEDRFNIEDYNRIKNNLAYLHEKSVELIKPFSIEDMGEDLADYTQYWDVDVFNAFEINLDRINENAYRQEYGLKQTFYENGKFPDCHELNRIESATLDIKGWISRQEAGLRKIPFTLGRFKEVRI